MICGAAPVTRAPGKSRTVGFRYTANKPARVAITSFADNSRHASTWASDTYQRAWARGARHPHAIRISPGPRSASSGPAGPPTPPTNPHGSEASNA